jgi:hypothetical protein
MRRGLYPSSPAIPGCGFSLRSSAILSAQVQPKRPIDPSVSCTCTIIYGNISAIGSLRMNHSDHPRATIHPTPHSLVTATPVRASSPTPDPALPCLPASLPLCFGHLPVLPVPNTRFNPRFQRKSININRLHCMVLPKPFRIIDIQKPWKIKIRSDEL